VHLGDRRRLPVVDGDLLHEILHALRELRRGPLLTGDQLFDAALIPV
jgi:hypothetical protein